MESEDGTTRHTWLPVGSGDRPVSQSLEGGEDHNLVQIQRKEVPVYAFLDSIEREDWGALGAPLETVTVDFRTGSPEAPPAEILVARFDCVRADYFNGEVDAFRTFYSTKRGEDIDSDHDLSKKYWHDPDQTDEHLAGLARLYREADAFFVLYMVVAVTDFNEAFFDRLFESEGWIGLGLFPKTAPGVPAILYPHEDDALDAPRDIFRISTVYDLTARRKNHLRHVFSVDFAPDAVMPPGRPPVPRPRVPVRGPSGKGLVTKRKKARRLQQDKLKITILNSRWMAMQVIPPRIGRSIVDRPMVILVRREDPRATHSKRLKTMVQWRKTKGFL